MFEGTKPQAFNETKRKARKDHNCCECQSLIPKGDSYIYASGIWDGEPNSYKTCSICADVRLEYIKSTGEMVCFGYLGEAIADTLCKDFDIEDYAKSSGFTVEVIRKVTRGWMNQ